MSDVERPFRWVRLDELDEDAVLVTAAYLRGLTRSYGGPARSDEHWQQEARDLLERAGVVVPGGELERLLEEKLS